MTIGIGGSTPEQQLSNLQNMTSGVQPISHEEFQNRLEKARNEMCKAGIDAIYLNAGTNLYYFTGTRWYASERLVGAIFTQKGELHYICPEFEKDTLEDYKVIDGVISCWEEHESPYALFGDLLKQLNITSGVIGLDEASAFFLTNGIQQANPHYQYCDASCITALCRRIKSPAELALLQRAKEMTLRVHQAAAQMLKPGISTTEVTAFIHQAHQAVGASGSSFCIVLFGEATAYPHGVKDPQILAEGDMVLIDTGCTLQGYNSDITRSYVYGTPSKRQRDVWNIEKAAQAAAFSAARIGAPCASVDAAARRLLEQHDFGPGYKIPGLPHRTGHGIGLDIHEWPYLVGSDQTPLQAGMCFSNEPMICIPGEFGIRHEDHFYMTEEGPRWFTQPAHSIDDPFGYEAQ